MVKVRVRVGSAEAEVEADPEHLREAIDLIPSIIEKLPDIGASAQMPHPSQEAAVKGATGATGPTPHPTVSIERDDSLSEVIGKFFADPWGRDRRKLSDVREVLQSYGLNYPKQSVAVALLRLAKTTKIRRFKAEDGEFVYTAGAQSVSASPAP